MVTVYALYEKNLKQIYVGMTTYKTGRLREKYLKSGIGKEFLKTHIAGLV